MADLNKTVAIIFDATDLTSDSVAKISAGLRGMAEDTDATGKSAEDAGGKIKRMGDEGEGSVLTLANAMRALAASFVVQEFIDANVAAETLGRTLEVLTGSQAEAAAEMDYIKDLANRLGANVYDLGDAYVKWVAATQDSAVAGADAKEIFEGFAGTMATLGASTSDISGAMTQLSQGVSKGKFELEDLKSIAERVPGFFGLMADSIGVTTGELFKMVSQGEITGETMVGVAATLKEKFGDVEYVDTFAAAWERLKNRMTELEVALGGSGTMDKIENYVVLATAAVNALKESLGEANAEASDPDGFFAFMDDGTGAVPAIGMAKYADAILSVVGAYLKAKAGAADMGAEAQTTNDILERFMNTIAAADPGDLGQVLEVLQQMRREGTIDDAEFAQVYDAILAKAQGTWQGVADATGVAKDAAIDLKDETKKVNEALKSLGIDPKDIAEPVEEATARIQAAVAELVNNPATKPEEMFTAMIFAIDQIANDGLPALEAAARGALTEGKLNADQYSIVMDAIADKAAGKWPEAMVKTSDEFKKQEEAAKKAEEQAQRYQLEMEKLSSNERIKLIEAKVALNVAEIQADAQVATAAIDSLTQSISDSYDFVVDLAGMLTESMNTPRDRYLKGLMDEAQEQTKELHDAQMELIDAQVEYMVAKTNAVANGNPVVSIQADGLAPHLEAFMWEILKQIQVRMAQDGGDMLVGGCSL